MAQAREESPDVASWELVCFCLYTADEKRELLGHPRLPMRTIDEIFLCRAILGKLFMTSNDCHELKRRLRTSGFLDDLNSLPVFPDSPSNVHNAYERAKRAIKPSYPNDEKDINKKWYKDHSFSIEVLMLMTKNSMDSRLRKKSPPSSSKPYGSTFTGNTDTCESTRATGRSDPVNEFEPPKKKRKPNEVIVEDDDAEFSNTGHAFSGNQDAPTGMQDVKPPAGSHYTTAAPAPKSVPVTPMRDEWNPFRCSHVDLTSEDAITPTTIDMTQSHDDNDDEVEEQTPLVLYNLACSQSEDEHILEGHADKDESILIEEEQAKEVTTGTMVHYVHLDGPTKRALTHLMITLVVWSVCLHVQLGTLPGFGDQNNPLRFCLSFSTVPQPRKPIISSSNHGPWLEQENMLLGMTSTSLHEQCSPWYWAVSTTLGVLATMWLISRLLQRLTV